MDAAIAEATDFLCATEGLSVIAGAPLAEHTSFGIGGPADLLVIPHGMPALLDALPRLVALGLPLVYLGNGTNVLVSDAGVRGVVVKIGGSLLGLQAAGTELVAGAGESLAAVCHLAADAGLSGLEFSAGIPGTVGGAAIMNAGAYGGEMAQVVSWVEVASLEGGVTRLSAEEAGFGYRGSHLRNEARLVCRVGLRLTPGDAREIHCRVWEILEQRAVKQPLAVRSAGCIFKRPEGDYAGRLVEAVSGKALCVGDAMVSPKHANFIINRGHARARDVLALIRLVQARVREEYGVDLETEICLLGEEF
jgi:UDP-N-acetylmuramate dehydrogenase